MNVVKWGILTGVAIALISVIVSVFTSLDAIRAINQSIGDVRTFTSECAVYISNWRGVLNIFCNPYIINIGFGIWLMYPVYLLIAALIRKAFTFVFR